MIPAGSARRERLSHPGVIACLLIAVVAPWPSVYGSILSVTGIWQGGMITQGLSFWLDGAASAVFVSWVTIYLVDRWRPDPSWPDRAGRLIGWTCLTFGAVTNVGMAIEYAFR